MLEATLEDLKIDEIIKITSHPQYQSIEEFLLEILIESRRENITNVELLLLQHKIIEKIIPLEKRISYFKKTANSQTRNPEWFTREVYKAQWRAIKQVMDGIAWRMLHFDRPSIRQIVEHSNTGHLSEGVLKEIQKAGEIVNNSDYFVIINDLTNFLRQGDLTILTPDKVFIDEVKTKGKATKEQKESLEKLLKRLNKRVLEIGNEQAEVIEIVGYPSNFLKEVESIIIQSKSTKDGICAKRVSPYLWVSCIYSPAIETNLRSGYRPNLPVCPFSIREPFLAIGNFTLFDSFSPNSAPYTIFPFPEEIIVELILGKLQLKAIMSEKELVESARGKGWTLTLPTREELLQRYDKAKNRAEIKVIARSVDNYASFKKGAFEYKMGREVLFRIALEFLSIKALIESAEQVMAKSAGVQRTFTTHFSEEYKMWK